MGEMKPILKQKLESRSPKNYNAKKALYFDIIRKNLHKLANFL
jgi:hypothetical protein